jgi:hypothetical protein
MSLEQRHRTPNSGETPEGEERALNSSTTTETYRIPGSADQEQFEESTYDPNKQRGKRRGLRLIGASAALAVILAGGGYALTRGGDNVEAKTPPVATAPADPGETAPSTTGGAEILNNLTLANFPYEIDGKTYEGFEAFKAALAIKAGDYSEYSTDDGVKVEVTKDSEQATTQVVDLINTWLNYDITTIKGVTPEVMDKYEYTQPDGSANTGESALKREFVDTAFEKILFEKTDLENAKYPQSFIDDIKSIAARVQSLNEFTKDETHPYRGEFVIVEEPDAFIAGKHLDRPGVTASTEVVVQYKDNSAQNTVGESQDYLAPIGLEKPYIWSMALDSSGTSQAGQYEPTDRAGEFGPYWRIALLQNAPKKTM